MTYRRILCCSYVFLYEKAYQQNDTGVESSVMTKVKGFGYQDNQVQDTADYVYPPQVGCQITPDPLGSHCVLYCSESE